MGCDTKLNSVNGILAFVHDESNLSVHKVARRWLSETQERNI
jgi:hypothetical protein